MPTNLDTMPLISKDDSLIPEMHEELRDREAGLSPTIVESTAKVFTNYIVQFKRVTMLNKDNSHDVTLNKIVSTSRVSTNGFIVEARMTNHSELDRLYLQLFAFGASTNNSRLYR